MKGIHDCKIISQSEVAPGIVRTLLSGPEIARESAAGQFVNVRVAETTDPLLRRPFSIHAVYPDEGTFSLLYVLRGRGTALLNKMRPGEIMNVVGPLGRGFDLGDSPEAEHVVVAGGCGAAPLHFLCDALCAKWGCETTTVLAGAQRREGVICEEEFKSHGVEVEISTDDGSYGYRGFVTQLLEEYLRKRKAAPSPLPYPKSSGQAPPGEGVASDRSVGEGVRVRVYSCGPNAMMKEVARISREAGAQSCQVSLENNMSCAIGVCMGCVQKIKGAAPGDDSGRDWHYERVCKDGPVFEAEDVIWD